MKIYFGFHHGGRSIGASHGSDHGGGVGRDGAPGLTRHLVEEGAPKADLRLGAREVYKRDMGWLQECDAFVAEVSGSSFGLGFEAGYLLGGTDKPVLLLYRREPAQRISLLITGNTHPRCALAAYADWAETEEYLRCASFFAGA